MWRPKRVGPGAGLDRKIKNAGQRTRKRQGDGASNAVSHEGPRECNVSGTIRTLLDFFRANSLRSKITYMPRFASIDVPEFSYK